MSEWKLTTPVAFIIFNRPDTTERVFSEIAKAKPPKLLVVADGPRANRLGEAEKCATTRSIIDRVNWDCEVLVDFSDRNLGCKRRVSSGINWIFEQVEEAIILEDDCLPHPSFFRFCQELLERYRHDHRVSQISGINFQLGYQINSDSYYFSKYTHIWGWASWRNRWQNNYDVNLEHWPRIRDEGRLGDLVGEPVEEKYWAQIFEQVYQGQIDTWDYQWAFACMLQGRLSILPNVNLISNIGFGPDATHTTGGSVLANLQLDSMQFPLRHPENMLVCRTLDRRFFKRFSTVSLYRRIKNKVSQIVKMRFKN